MPWNRPVFELQQQIIRQPFQYLCTFSGAILLQSLGEDGGQIPTRGKLRNLCSLASMRSSTLWLIDPQLPGLGLSSH